MSVDIECADRPGDNYTPLFMNKYSSDLLARPLRVRQTSLKAFEALQDHLGENQQAVLGVIVRFGPCSNKDVARILGWPINCVTPRVLELRKKELVVEAGSKVQDGRKALLWGVQ